MFLLCQGGDICHLKPSFRPCLSWIPICMLDMRKGGPASQVQNLSWAIVLFTKQVPHQSSELDMQTSPHPHMHGLWTHEGGGNRPESPHGVFNENPFCGTAWSRAVTGI